MANTRQLRQTRPATQTCRSGRGAARTRSESARTRRRQEQVMALCAACADEAAAACARRAWRPEGCLSGKALFAARAAATGTLHLASARHERYNLKHLQQQALRQACPVRVWLGTGDPGPESCAQALRVRAHVRVRVGCVGAVIPAAQATADGANRAHLLFAWRHQLRTRGCTLPTGHGTCQERGNVVGEPLSICPFVVRDEKTARRRRPRAMPRAAPPAEAHAPVSAQRCGPALRRALLQQRTALRHAGPG